jgi:hypothetical protein
MASRKTSTQQDKNLFRRYLIWCYKTTKEEMERVDRKFTQLRVDEQLLELLLKKKEPFPPELAMHYTNEIEKFKRYIKDKEVNAQAQKFVDKDGKVLQPHYAYLKNRLEAVEKSIRQLFGKKELTAIQSGYEAEMTRRIWEAREHT